MKAEDFIELIEQNRFDKISKNGMTLIAERFRELENNQHLNYWKQNAEEDYIKTPISVLRYISELEKAINIEQ